MCNQQDMNECVDQILFESEMSRPLPRRNNGMKEQRRQERVARKLENSKIKRTRNSCLKLRKILSEFQKGTETWSEVKCKELASMTGMTYL